MNRYERRGIEKLPQRKEVRYLLANDCHEQLIERLGEIGFIPQEYDYPIIQTIYFASRKGEVPQNGYIRIRRYVNEFDPGSELNITPNSHWWLEIKSGLGEKERTLMQFGEILEILALEKRMVLEQKFKTAYNLLTDFNKNLVPVAMTQWRRESFIHELGTSRVTIDSNLAYYGFIRNQSGAKLMGKSDQLKVETKTPVGFDGSLSIKEKILYGLNYEVPDKKWQERIMREMYANLLNANRNL